MTTVRWRQAVAGIPAADGELRVNVTADGRVLSVLGAPARGLDADPRQRRDGEPGLQQRLDVHAARRQVARARAVPVAPAGSRTINGADDASILYHEYAHGLSNRLVTDAAGRGALNSAQAGAMGEGWSDWYAKDFLVGRFPALDNPAIAGEIDMGTYTDSVAHTIRHQALDCPVGAPAALCPAACSAGSGGFTYDDVGRIQGFEEVHADGEI